MILSRYIAAAVSGVFLSLAFPPFSQSDTVWFAFVPLMFALRKSTAKEGFRLGFLSGFVFWLIDLFWLWQLKDNGGPLPLVILGHILLSAYCALYTGLFGFCTAGLCKLINSRKAALWSKSPDQMQTPAAGTSPTRKLANSLTLFIAEPIFWVGSEYLRGIVLSGFPWNPIAASQYRNTALLHCISWCGVGMISLLVIGVNSGITSMGYRIWRDVFKPRFKNAGDDEDSEHRPRSRFQIRSGELAIALLATVMIWSNSLTSVRKSIRQSRTGSNLRVALIHPEAPCIFKKDDDSVATANQNILDYTALAADAKPDICIWPETSLPGYIPYDQEGYRMITEASGALNGTPLLVGAVELRYKDPTSPETSDYDIYNSAFLFGEQAGISAIYRKQHLVPFGEYIPLETKIPFLKRLAPTGFSCTAGTSPCLFKVNTKVTTNDSHQVDSPWENTPDSASKIVTGAMICFEDAFPYIARNSAKQGADLLATLANDAWFDGSAEAEQHLAQAVLRCVENHRPMLRSTNRGVSAVIDQDGRIVRRIGEGHGAGTPGFAVHELNVLSQKEITSYTKYGDWLLHIPAAILLGIVFIVSINDGKIID